MWRVLIIAIALSGCQTSSSNRRTYSFDHIAKVLHTTPPKFDRFLNKGPLTYQILTDRKNKLPGEPEILTDLVMSHSKSPAPLVIISHGNHSHKEAHRYQAIHLASWGIHTLVLQMPNEGRWLRNGTTIHKLTKYLQNKKSINPRIDTRRIVLVGHSFGGSAISIAASLGADVVGLIYLDPAMVHDKVKKALRKIDAPIMLLGADRKVFRSRRRPLFFKIPRTEVAEISVRGATHDDAQNPSMFAIHSMGSDPFTSEERQQIFTAALTASAISMTTEGSTDYAWSTFNTAIKQGMLTRPRRKTATGPSPLITH